MTQETHELLRREMAKLEIKFRARGAKSSEGDGRTAADIERERAAKETAR